MMEMKEFKNYVKHIRDIMPATCNNRRVVITDEYTKQGQTVRSRAKGNIGYYLHDVYDRYSPDKQRAYNDVYEMYCQTDGSEGFSICSANSFGFTVSWYTPEEIVFITKDIEYHVLKNH